jgi:hypothetical protein
VLRGFDIYRWRPRLFLVVDHVWSLRTHLFLKRSNSRLIRRAGNNGWYVPADGPVQVAASDRWEILRKYYLALPFRAARDALRRGRRLYGDWWAGR